MNLGIFSISLTVKDLKASRTFYEALGFKKFGGDEAHNYLIMQLGTTTIGLFQGMFDKNILTFNPDDARTIQKHLKAQGIDLIQEIEDEDGEGPASLTLIDPDGNPILFDQHDAEFMRQVKPKGTVQWVDMTVDDADEMRDFYEAVIGWTHEDVPVGDHTDYNMLRTDGIPATGICHKQGENATMPSGWVVYFRVADFDASLATAQEKGATVLVPTRGNKGHRFAVLEDPAKSVFAIGE